VAATVAVLGVSGLVVGCQNGPPLDGYVHAVFETQCERIFSCCSAAGHLSIDTAFTSPEGCRLYYRDLESLAVEAIRADLDADFTAVDETALASCLMTLEATSCSEYFGTRARNCEHAFKPKVENGGDCSSNLACRGGLCVDFVCRGDTRPLGAACQSDDDCLSSYCSAGACAVSPGAAACSGANAGK
jgi:hypothetical protein